MSITFGCSQNKIMKCNDQQIFCIDQSTQTCLFLIQQKQLIRYHYGKEQIVAKCVWNQITNKSIFDISHSNKHQMYFVLCEDWKVYFLHMELTLIVAVQFECKQFTHLHYIEGVSTFLMVQTQNVALYDFRLDDGKVSVAKRFDFKSSLKWNRSCRVVRDLLLLYNTHQIQIIRLNDFSVVGGIQIQLTASDWYYCNDFIIVGDISGQLKIFTKSNYVHHHFENAHEGIIKNIIGDEDNGIIYTFGQDNKIKVWNINLLQFCAQYLLPCSSVSFFKFINCNTYLCNSVQQLCIGDLNHKLDTFYIHNSEIIAFSHKCIAFRNHVYYSLQKGSTKFITAYTSNVIQILDSPYDDSYWIHFVNGDLIEWKQQEIVNHYRFQNIREVNGDSLRQSVVCVHFVNYQVPFSDVQCKLDTNDHQKIMKQITVKGSTDYQWMAMGCSKGDVIFVSLKCFNLLYARFNYNKESIIHIKSIDNMLIVISQDNVINFISDKPQLLHTMTIKNLGPITTALNYLVVGVGNQLIFVTNKFSLQQSPITHDSPIIGLESNCETIISHSIQQIKVWNMQQNVYTIQLHSNIDCCILHEQLIISVDGVLSNFTIPQYTHHSVNNLHTKCNDSESLLEIDLQSNDISPKAQSLRRSRVQEIPLKVRIQQHVIQRKLNVSPSKVYSKSMLHSTNKANTSVNNQSAILNTSTQEKLPQILPNVLNNNKPLYAMPAIPTRIPAEQTILQKFIQRRVRKGPPKNRREWTMDKIVLHNIIQKQGQ